MGMKRYPEPAPPDSYAPAYVPEVTYVGGSPGNEFSQSTAASTDDFYPKTQAEKAEIHGQEVNIDVGVPPGYIAPGEPYAPPPPDPTLASIAPTSGVTGGDPILVTLTGTGFTQFSTVTTGGLDTPYVQFVSDTALTVALDPRSVAGTIDVVVTDHGVTTLPQQFTFTEATSE